MGISYTGGAGGAHINGDAVIGSGSNGSADAGVAARKKAAAEAVRALSGGPRKQTPANTPAGRALAALKQVVGGRSLADVHQAYDETQGISK